MDCLYGFKTPRSRNFVAGLPHKEAHVEDSSATLLAAVVAKPAAEVDG